jgi:hypothetical protein
MEMLRKEASQREFSICHCLSFPKDRFNNWDPCLLPVSLCILVLSSTNLPCPLVSLHLHSSELLGSELVPSP